MRFMMPKRIGAFMLVMFMCLGMFPIAAFAEGENPAEEVQQVVEPPIHEHVWGGWTVVTEETCTTPGLQRHECPCGASETAAISAIPHSFGEWTVTKESTCAEAGEQWHACTVCGAVETDAIPALPHYFGEWTVTKESTCTEAGEQWHVCTVCGAVETAAISIAPHSFGEWTVTEEPTCTEVGERQHACTVCGAVEKEAVSVAPHSFGEWIVTREPTCTKEGRKEHTCNVCGAIEKETVPVLPHSFGVWEVTREATCTEKGKQQRACVVCGEVEKESIPVFPHSFGEWEITREPTCTENGRQQHVCDVCGEVEKESIPVIPHDFGEWEITREPTCTKEGKQERSCTVCGEVEKEYIPVTEHDWDEDGVCTVCGAEDENKPEEIKTYTVLWLNEDGEELERDEAVPEGTIPGFDGTVPAKDEDDDYTYEFSGWNPEPVPATEDAVYTAQYAKTERRSDAMQITEIVGAVSVSVSAPEGAFPWGTEIRIAPASADVSSIAENAELVGAAQLSFVKKGEAQTATSPVSVSISMIAAQNEADTWQVFQESSGALISQSYGSGFSVTEAAVFGVARIPAETFTVTFDPANGEEPVSISVEAGSAIGEENMPVAPTKEHCDFEKWVDTEDGDTEITAETVVAANMTVLAVYKRQMPAVSFQKSSGGVYVSVTAEEGTFPAGTEMTVTPLGSDSSLEAMSDGQSEEVVAIRMVDITFWFDGKEIQPEKPVAVTLGVAWYADEQSIDVVHFSDGGFSVVASDVAGTAASFAADHFSPYGVIVKAGPPLGQKDGTDLFATNVSDLVDDDGKPKTGFYISIESKNSAHNVYYFKDNDFEYTTDQGSKLTVVERTAANDIGSASVYSFLKKGDKYYIYTEANGKNMFLKTGLGDDNSLLLVEADIDHIEESDATPFDIRIDEKTGGAVIEIFLDNGSRYRRSLNLKSEDAGLGFQGYKYDSQKERDRANPEKSLLRLVFSDEIKNSTDPNYNDPYNLNGKSYAIFYSVIDNNDETEHSGKALSIETDGNNAKIKPMPVTITGNDSLQVDYNGAAKLITWIFEIANEGGGHYYLRTEDNKYLRFKSPADIGLVDSKDSATVISVSPGSSGGHTGSASGPMTEGKYRFSWTDGTYNNETVAIETTNKEKDYFFGYGSNKKAQNNATQWLYLAQRGWTVTYKYVGEVPEGAPAVPEEATYDYEATVPAADVPAVEGYTFHGWTGEVTKMPDNDVEVTGYWTINTHDVTYKYTGNVQPEKAPPVPAKATYEYGAKVPAAAVPTLEGYIFHGWTGEITTMPDNDVEVTGYWEEAGDEVIVTISGVQETVLYNGTAHTVIGFQATSNNAEYNKNIDDNFSYSTATPEVTGTYAGTYTVDLQALANSCKNENKKFTKVTFRVNQNNRYNVLTINPRTVILTSASDEKEYDGEALTNETVTVTGDGFIGGQGAAYTFSGTQTEEGSSQNTFTYTLTGGALAANYNITTNFGTLTVHAAAADENIEDEETPKAETPEEIDEDDTPLALMPTWALINLIATILTVCVAAGMVVSYFRNKDDEEEDGLKRELTDEEEENERKKSKFLGLIPGIGSVITFLLTEDMRLPMVLVDRWTILMIAILVIGAGLAYLTRNKDEEEEEQPEEV